MTSFDFSIAEKDLNTSCIGRKINHKVVTVTTMNDAEDGARQGDPHGTVYIADVMTDGRGTKGRNWVATSNENLYMSIILHMQLLQDEDPSVSRRKEFDIDVAGALASLQALEEIGLKEVKIKWLNDLWVKGHKILGALTEYKGKITVDSRDVHLYVLGIGLNVNCDMRRDPVMHRISTSVMCELGRSVSREVIFAKICNHLEPLLKMDRQELLKLYKLHEAFQCGDKVKVYKQDNSVVNCTFREVNDDWSVELIEDGHCTPVCFPCTEISLRQIRAKVVYVLNGQDFHSWSSECLLKTCNSLLDIQTYEVKSISAEKVNFDTMTSCAMVIIGQLTSVPKSTPNYMTIIEDYVKKGGSCLAIGNACSLFQSEDGNEIKGQHPTQVQEEIPSIIETIVCSVPSSEQRKQHVHLCLFQDNCQLFPTHYTTSNILAYRDLNTKDDIRESDGTHICDQCIDNSTDVVVLDVGKGKLCLCRPNIEICYADLHEYFPRLEDKSGKLKDTVHHRDLLFQDILTKLL
ncbi:uncharacterized protein LOC132746152 [Ruditapes philippinarum]|uniref:uncharacterized protein LOC132746152 n=1 Tax=Ruditapes philippinarum TaxID=129788 RepID=UPI00295A7F3A|nr:uncharacterized protein LOC132746152 [Ruditapes philippinarum]